MNRRFLALLLSLLFAFSVSVPALATEPDFEIATEKAINTTVEATSFSAVGDFLWLDTEVYSVVLPTTNNFGFKLDPLGLLSIPDGERRELGELLGGRIIGVTTPAAFINNSAVPIKLTVEATASSSGVEIEFVTDAATYIESPVTSLSALNADEVGKDNVVALYLVPSVSNMVNPTGSAFEMASDAFLLVTDAAVKLEFSLPRARYLVYASGNSVYTMDRVADSGSGNTFQVGGYINKAADWTSYASVSAGVPAELDISIDFVYKYEKDEEIDTYDGDTDYYASPSAFGLLSSAATYTTMAAVEVPRLIGVWEVANSGFITDASNGTTALAATATWNRVVNPTLVVPFFAALGDSVSQVTVSPAGTAITSSSGGWVYDPTAKTLTLDSADPAISAVVPGDPMEIIVKTANSVECTLTVTVADPWDAVDTGFVLNATAYTTTAALTDTWDKVAPYTVGFHLKPGDSISTVTLSGAGTLASGTEYIYDASTMDFTISPAGVIATAGYGVGKEIVIKTDKNVNYKLTLDFENPWAGVSTGFVTAIGQTQRNITGTPWTRTSSVPASFKYTIPFYLEDGDAVSSVSYNYGAASAPLNNTVYDADAHTLTFDTTGYSDDTGTKTITIVTTKDAVGCVLTVAMTVN